VCPARSGVIQVAYSETRQSSADKMALVISSASPTGKPPRKPSECRFPKRRLCARFTSARAQLRQQQRNEFPLVVRSQTALSSIDKRAHRRPQQFPSLRLSDGYGFALMGPPPKSVLAGSWRRRNTNKRSSRLYHCGISIQSIASNPDTRSAKNHMLALPPIHSPT